jgi:DnaJ-class molecular chaperone
MLEAVVCPRCEGEKRIYNARSGRDETCPTCNGEGVKWHGAAEETAVPAATSDPLDLTYTP